MNERFVQKIKVHLPLYKEVERVVISAQSEEEIIEIAEKFGYRLKSTYDNLLKIYGINGTLFATIYLNAISS